MNGNINPDCRDGKHDACSGTAWDTAADQEALCQCSCKHNGIAE